jgi:DNA-binding Lrp family transcriptional regulator
MPPRAFTDEQLARLHAQGLGVSQIARALGVGKSAVSRRLKRLKARSIPPGEVIDIERQEKPKPIERKLDAFGQLEHINQLCNMELDFLQESLANCKPLQRPIIQKQQLAHVQEIRAQIKLLAEIAQAVTHYEEVKKFQEIVLQEIGNVSPEARDKILSRLEKRSSIGSLLSIS